MFVEGQHDVPDNYQAYILQHGDQGYGTDPGSGYIEKYGLYQSKGPDTQSNVWSLNFYYPNFYDSRYYNDVSYIGSSISLPIELVWGNGAEANAFYIP